MHNTNTRKKLEIAFRRWISRRAPSFGFCQHLPTIDPTPYRVNLERQFAPGMSWGNFGSHWQIDHIVPLCLFDLSNPAQIALAWSLDNLRPLIKQDNRIRGASFESAYLALIGRTPINEQDYLRLLALVEPTFKASYPGLRVEKRV